MSSSDATTMTARLHLVQRIQKFLDMLERVKRQPNRREAYHALVALECLAGQDYEKGTTAMSRAEQVAALPAEVASLPGIHETMTTQNLRHLLNDTLADEG